MRASLVLGLTAVAFWLSGCDSHSETRRREARNQLQQVQLALQNYHQSTTPPTTPPATPAPPEPPPDNASPPPD